MLVGESGKGQREVQVLYSEPGGRELYFFVNNRLDRIVKYAAVTPRLPRIPLSSEGPA